MLFFLCFFNTFGLWGGSWGSLGEVLGALGASWGRLGAPLWLLGCFLVGLAGSQAPNTHFCEAFGGVQEATSPFDWVTALTNLGEGGLPKVLVY